MSADLIPDTTGGLRDFLLEGRCAREHAGVYNLQGCRTIYNPAVTGPGNDLHLEGHRYLVASPGLLVGVHPDNGHLWHGF